MKNFFQRLWNRLFGIAPVTKPAVKPVEPPKVVEPVKPTPGVIRADSPGVIRADWNNAEWTNALLRALWEHGPVLMAAPVEGVCGNRDEFWVMLFSSLARYESAFNPAATYREEFPDANGNRVVSRGLFQLSIESVNGSRYKCGIKKAEDLHDPLVNIRCAVIVANALIREDNVIHGGHAEAWLGMARYWSPFRDKAKTKVIMDKARSACV